MLLHSCVVLSWISHLVTALLLPTVSDLWLWNVCQVFLLQNWTWCIFLWPILWPWPWPSTVCCGLAIYAYIDCEEQDVRVLMSLNRCKFTTCDTVSSSGTRKIRVSLLCHHTSQLSYILLFSGSCALSLFLIQWNCQISRTNHLKCLDSAVIGFSFLFLKSRGEKLFINVILTNVRMTFMNSSCHFYILLMPMC